MTEILAFIWANWFSLVLLLLALFLLLYLLFKTKTSHYLLLALLIWFPLENLFLRYTPLEYYAGVKYLPEVILYSAVIFSWLKFIREKKQFLPHAAINKWLLGFIAVAIISYFLNWYRLWFWALGLRQTLRFICVFYIVAIEQYDRHAVRQLLSAGLFMVVAEALLGIVQYAARGYLDPYLFFTDRVNLGSTFQLEGLEQTWAAGERVFATLGRYDRLGSFLALGLVLMFPWFYYLKDKVQKIFFSGAFFICAFALVLTYSRASWLAAVVGCLFIGYRFFNDKRLLKFSAIAGIMLAIYIGSVIIFQNYGGAVIERQSQTITQRLVEAFSPYSWKENYYGYGRYFFLINTPLIVVRSYPLFGVGPGNYGGGVAATLWNSRFYDRLHLPFGIQNQAGQIDNNWFSIWGEVGTLGFLCWIIIFFTIYKNAHDMQERAKSTVDKALSQGLCGLLISISILGFFGPYFEFRALMMYFWLVVGVVLATNQVERDRWNFLKK